MAKLWPLVQELAFSYRPERSIFERSFSELIERPDTLVLVAVANTSAVVGYLLGSYHGTFFANGPVAWIEELMVSESIRHHGVATKLMSSAEDWARTIPTAYIALASRRRVTSTSGLATRIRQPSSGRPSSRPSRERHEERLTLPASFWDSPQRHCGPVRHRAHRISPAVA